MKKFLVTSSDHWRFASALKSAGRVLGTHWFNVSYGGCDSQAWPYYQAVVTQPPCDPGPDTLVDAVFGQASPPLADDLARPVRVDTIDVDAKEVVRADGTRRPLRPWEEAALRGERFEYRDRWEAECDRFQAKFRP